MTHAFDPDEPYGRNDPDDYEPQTAMLLTEMEWHDLATMLKFYEEETRWIRWCENDHPLFRPDGGGDKIVRRRALAQRIIEADS